MALTLSGLNFIFKGGTALLLLLDTPCRFSIDVDIVLDAPQDLESNIRHILSQDVFLRYEENQRGGEIPKQPF